MWAVRLCLLLVINLLILLNVCLPQATVNEQRIEPKTAQKQTLKQFTTSNCQSFVAELPREQKLNEYFQL